MSFFSVRLRLGGGTVSAPLSSVGLFLQLRCLVPGLLSGPRRLGTASYSQTFDLRTQLLHTGRVESQRIFRPRLPKRCLSLGYER